MTDRKKINVLVAEDSAVTRIRLVHLLQQDPHIHVLGAVNDGQAALDFLARHQKPDVILMDIHMPRLDGFEATRRIMETDPVPIVVCSAISNVGDAAFAFRALEVGAVACIDKPFGGNGEDTPAKLGHLLETLKLMSEVRMVRRRRRAQPASTTAGGPCPTMRPPARLVGIGASTGGPPVLQSILAGLPADFPVPLLVVQHIAHGFLPGMVEWLAHSSGPQVRIATPGIVPLPGHVYLAPDDLHMGIAAGGRINLSREAPENHIRPAVSFLFRSLAEHCGAAAIGVLLTGMGRDGAQELKNMRHSGAATIAQDQESSVVHGMPGQAIALGAAGQVLAAERIAAALIALVTPTPGSRSQPA